MNNIGVAFGGGKATSVSVFSILIVAVFIFISGANYSKNKNTYNKYIKK